MVALYNIHIYLLKQYTTFKRDLAFLNYYEKTEKCDYEILTTRPWPLLTYQSIIITNFILLSMSIFTYLSSSISTIYTLC